MRIVAVVALVVSWSLASLVLALLVRAHRDLKRVLAEKEQLRKLHQDYMAGPAVLSHELRTPLTVVRGAAELLADGSAGPMNDVQMKFAKTIAENAHQVVEMADDLLAEVRLESDLFNLRLQRVEMRELVRRNVAQMRRFHSSPIRLENHGAPIYMSLDPRLMGQAIANVINNAARHAGDDVSIVVTVQAFDEDVTISIVDDGRGMTQEEKERLFIPFDTGGSLRPGTGLGMMLTQKILKLHGGTILVDTVSSKGTTFYLTIPRTIRSGDQSLLSEEGQVSAKALVVDDEPQILMIIKFALETAGITVETASDGAKAWEKFTTHYYDLVILDLMIPVISGISLAQRIRAMSDVPIIMITALSEESDRIKGLESGADDYITKPFSPKEMTLRAQALLRRSKKDPNDVVSNGPLRIDRRDRKVYVDGVPVELSSTERRFLDFLASHIGEPVSYRELLNSVWETQDSSGGKDMIKMTAYRLRGALGDRGES